jgi:hypothetical protein
LTIDPNDHNTVYAGTGDLNFGSFSMGSQGILKSTDAKAKSDSETHTDSLNEAARQGQQISGGRNLYFLKKDRQRIGRDQECRHENKSVHRGRFASAKRARSGR